MRLTAATYQGEPVLECIASNTQTITAVAAEAAADGIDLLLFAELFLTGYNIPPPRLEQLAICQDGPEMQIIRDVASKYKIAIALGYSESVATGDTEGATVYNSCILVDGTGRTVINYRKCHLWDPYLEHEKLVFASGECLSVGDLTLGGGEVVRIGILICFDIEFPEPARVLALQGAQLLLVPTALAEGPVADSTPTVAVPGRAAENNLFIVYSNLIGSSSITTHEDSNEDTPKESAKSNFCGQSGIFGPDGRDLARASKTATGLFRAVLESSAFEAYIHRNNYLQERRPDLYSNMTTSEVTTCKAGGLSPTVSGAAEHRPFIHFNAAGDSPMPVSVLQKVKSVLDTEHRLGGYAAAEEVYAQEYTRVYELIGELINCSVDNVGLVDSATTAWTRAFYSVDLQPGDIVLTCAVEYASNYVAILQQAKRHNAVVVAIPSSEDGSVSVGALIQLLQQHGRKVKVVSITWIPTNGGVVNDAAAIGGAIAEHGPGVLYLLDACQAVGHVPIDVQQLQCHVLSATGRKYLRGPRGTGFLFVSPSALDVLTDPATIDLLSAPYDGGTYSVVPTAKRFEQWEKNIAALLGMGEAIDHLLHSVGPDFAFEQIVDLAIELREKLRRNKSVVLWDLGTTLDRQSRCGIVTFSVANLDADSVKKALRTRDIFVSTTGPSSTPLDASSRKLPRLVRASVHYFNTSHEIDSFCDVINDLVAGV
jgi:cysteine desulfurase / selenocysteine lyase